MKVHASTPSMVAGMHEAAIPHGTFAPSPLRGEGWDEGRVFAANQSPSPLRGEGRGEGPIVARIFTPARRALAFVRRLTHLFRTRVPSPPPSPPRGEGARGGRASGHPLCLLLV